MRHSTRDAGFSLMELMLVVAVMGAVATIAVMASERNLRRMRAHQAVTSVAQILGEARSAAITQEIPHLVYFREAESCAEPQEPIAAVVKDFDRSYSVSTGDQQRSFGFDGVDDCRVTGYGAFHGNEAPYPDLPLAGADLSQQVSSASRTPLPRFAGLPAVSADDDEGKASGTVITSVTHGASFPVDPASGDPAIAFNERGIPVALNTPQSWGSGVGAFYVTDNRAAVYAVSVLPLGDLAVHTWDPNSATWR